MQIILADGVNLAASAGRSLWMIGFSAKQTRVLNPIKVFLYVERFTDNKRERLTLVRITASGNVVPIIEVDKNEPCEDGTLIFLANTEDELFLIPEVIKIQQLFTDIVAEALQHRIENGLNQESLFFDIN